MTQQTIEPTPFNDAQFLWCTNWCKEQGLNPYDEKSWADAKFEYLKVHEAKERKG
ncbi:hypothetical protein [Acinetobacter sp. YH01021]|uniref:hypothetical protein n=1 Tax=Acinetobacter sp. YH01021 TaxID=2601035 RepID=UPI0015D1D588|nr:hypothetical protein [Acinetobacter sp. YH01021]